MKPHVRLSEKGALFGGKKPIKSRKGGSCMKTLNITTSWPRLEITSTRAQTEITTKIRRFKATRAAPQMKVERKAPSFKIDWNRVWAESGRRSPDILRRYSTQKNRGKVDSAVRRIAKNGDYMMALNTYANTKRNPIAELAWQNMYQDFSVETNVAYMPKTKPTASWDPGYVKIDWTTGELQIEWDNDFMPEVKVKPHSVEIRLSGRAEVKITVDDRRVARPSGRKVNKRA